MYAKVFTQIFDSSIADNWKHRHVFEDLLKLADRHGVVDMTPEAICARTRLPRKMLDEAIDSLSKPDPRSRTPDEGGRRIVPLDPQRPWGWRIVNFLKYREMRTEFDRTAYMRDYMRSKRLLDAVKPESNDVKLPASVSVQSTSSNSTVRGTGGVTVRKVEKFKDVLCGMYHRNPSRQWTHSEEFTLVELMRRGEFESELETIRRYRLTNPRYFPESIENLLLGWNRVLDGIDSKASRATRNAI